MRYLLAVLVVTIMAFNASAIINSADVDVRINGVRYQQGDVLIGHQQDNVPVAVSIFTKSGDSAKVSVRIATSSEVLKSAETERFYIPASTTAVKGLAISLDGLMSGTDYYFIVAVHSGIIDIISMYTLHMYGTPSAIGLEDKIPFTQLTNKAQQNVFCYTFPSNALLYNLQGQRIQEADRSGYYLIVQDKAVRKVLLVK